MNACADTWYMVPRGYRSILRALMNSENADDRARAQSECAAYGLDYATERERILAEMIVEGKALMKRQEERRG